jgi:uncharacterized protein YbjT (DUF2867 family)
MKLLLLGATGRSGQHILQKALKDDHQVVAIVRDPATLAESGAELVQGSPYDYETVEKAADGCDAVICTLNVSRTSDSPWAKLRAPKDLISKSVENALRAMGHKNIKRIITLSVLGAGDSKKSMPVGFNFFISLTNLKYAFRDHERQEKILAGSDVNWTAIRLPMLTDAAGEAETLVNMGDGVKLKNKINRESVARFVLSILDEAKYYKKIVTISNA